MPIAPLAAALRAELQARLRDALIDDAPHHGNGRPRRVPPIHPVLHPAPLELAEIPDQALAGFLADRWLAGTHPAGRAAGWEALASPLFAQWSADDPILAALGAAGISHLGELGILALIDDAQTAEPACGLSHAVLLRAVCRLLLGGPPLQLWTTVRHEDQTLVLTFGAAGASARLVVVTRIVAEWAISALDRGYDWPHWWPGDTRPAIQPVTILYCRTDEPLSTRSPEQPSHEFGVASGVSTTATVTLPLPAFLNYWRGRLRESLKFRQERVLVARLGLNGEPPLTLGEIGQREGLTRERIRQIEAKALKRWQAREFRTALRDWLRHAGIDLTRYDQETLAFVLQIRAPLHPGAAKELVRFAMAGIKPLPPVDSETRPLLTRLTAAAVRCLEDAGGQLDESVLRDALCREPWWDTLPPPIAEAIGESLERLSIVRRDGNQLVLAAEAGNVSAERRRELLVGLLEAQRSPLHISELLERHNAQPQVRRPISRTYLGNFLASHPDTFALCGRSTWGLTSWNVGRSASREELEALGLASARRSGVGDEIALLLYRTGHPLPISAIEDHILARFAVNASSVQASMAQDAARRFVQTRDGSWALRRWYEQDPVAAPTVNGTAGPAIEDTAMRVSVQSKPAAPTPRRPSRWVTREELDRVTARAAELSRDIDERLRRGLPGVSAETRFQYAVLKAALGQTEAVATLLKGFDPSDDPHYSLPAIRAVFTLDR